MRERVQTSPHKAGAACQAKPHLSPPLERKAKDGLVDCTVLAFDFGIKRIGVAVGEIRLGQARSLATIDAGANDTRFAAIEQLLAEWRPGRLVVGRPLNEDGTPHDMTARCERFAKQLRGRFALPVEEIDERFSSLAADEDLRRRGLGWRERKALVDAEAARIVLQNWLDDHINAHARDHVPA